MGRLMGMTPVLMQNLGMCLSNPGPNLGCGWIIDIFEARASVHVRYGGMCIWQCVYGGEIYVCLVSVFCAFVTHFCKLTSRKECLGKLSETE